MCFVFFQCSQKPPKSQNSQGCKFPFLMLVSHVLPIKLPNHKIHRDVKFHFLCLFLMCSRKSSRIRSIFHTGDSSVWDSVFFPNTKKNKVLSHSLPDIFKDQVSGYSLRGSSGTLYGVSPVKIPSKCWGWSNLVYTCKRRVTVYTKETSTIVRKYR